MSDSSVFFIDSKKWILESEVKDTCAKLNSSYQITGDEAIKKLNLKAIKDFNNRELANYYCERYLGIR